VLPSPSPASPHHGTLLREVVDKIVTLRLQREMRGQETGQETLKTR
jgi:hypothetical protein